MCGSNGEHEEVRTEPRVHCGTRLVNNTCFKLCSMHVIVVTGPLHTLSGTSQDERFFLVFLIKDCALRAANAQPLSNLFAATSTQSAPRQVAAREQVLLRVKRERHATRKARGQDACQEGHVAAARGYGQEALGGSSGEQGWRAAVLPKLGVHLQDD
jgi:hypothetical protein